MISKINYTKLIIITLGNLVLAFGMFNIHYQNNITEGGILGLSLLFGHWTIFSAGYYSVILDFTAYAISYKFLGKGFLIKSLYSSLMYGIFYLVFEKIGFIIPNLEFLPILSSVLGGIFVGIGVGLVIKSGGACGGDDALVLTINKLAKIKIQYLYLVFDFFVLLFSLSYIAPINLLYSLITVIISSFIIGRIHII